MNASPVLTGNAGSLQTALDRFRPIGPDGMERANLQDRRESRYLLTAEQAWDLISHLPDSSPIFEVDGKRVQTYSTTYFDSPGFSLYLEHHNGRINTGIKYEPDRMSDLI